MSDVKQNLLMSWAKYSVKEPENEPHATKTKQRSKWSEHEGLHIIHAYISASFFCSSHHYCPNAQLTNPYSVVPYELQRPLDSSFILFFGFTLIRHIRDTIYHWDGKLYCFYKAVCKTRTALTTSSFASSVSKGFRLLRATVKLQEQQTNLDMIPRRGTVCEGFSPFICQLY